MRLGFDLGFFSLVIYAFYLYIEFFLCISFIRRVLYLKKIIFLIFYLIRKALNGNLEYINKKFI